MQQKIVCRARSAHNMAIHHTPMSSVFGGGLAGLGKLEWFTVDVLESIPYLDQVVIFEWYAMWYGSKSGY